MTLKTTVSTLALSLSLILGGCGSVENTHSVTPQASAETKKQTESEKANALFESMFNEGVMASPMTQTYLGIKKDYGKWDEISEAANEKELARTKQNLTRLMTIDFAKLDEQAQLSYSLLKQNLQNEIADYQWRFHTYPVNQMYGVHSTTPSFLINQHQITDVKDAEAYISRLNGINLRFKQLEVALEERAKRKIIAPKFVFNYVISDSKNIINGAPFTDGKDSVLWADFKKKVSALELEPQQQTQLEYDAKKALMTSVLPAYQGFIEYAQQLQSKADTNDGAWKFPNGKAYYNNALARTTTTTMSADDIHTLGLSEVDRIHAEMRQIMKKVGFKGTLQEFFVFMRDDEQFYYPTNDEGKAAYLAKATSFIDNMESRLDEVFKIKPKAPLIAKQVEAFREKSAGKAFYQQPAPDGSRPGTYYANLYDMKAMPKYQMEALAYHEGIPGHHMQIAISQELKGIPKFRRFGGYTAYIEGWGLYSEYFPKEMGLYEDPYFDFGRLAMELWRACRLVVDTGIHAQKWTREQSIEYYTSNTPNAVSDAVKMVERHIVMPSQATAYKIGMIKILELRIKAKMELGDKFELRDFHTLILKNGPLPLSTLEQQVDNWIAKTK
ncbi:DUF885 domain-containing protein [Parashewanella spongiae]|uniref:DUF885 domain-containing protein n=1 Tax=Parashewanella spongiae TaxID=342950 RepID=A0A3A6T6X3_9GAMM|nr:DUF885 domain-containing protein [Parashewanella spongiae]MCL1080186.1 DUF885 domain-containing protein [Parashewanella spongiae]RJY02440.1 DUF885 domain-containing protein [Parashewanella spongiae]